MEILRTFLEQQLLLSMFLVIGLGYAVGQADIPRPAATITKIVLVWVILAMMGT